MICILPWIFSVRGLPARVTNLFRWGGSPLDEKLEIGMEGREGHNEGQRRYFPQIWSTQFVKTWRGWSDWLYLHFIIIWVAVVVDCGNKTLYLLPLLSHSLALFLHPLLFFFPFSPQSHFFSSPLSHSILRSARLMGFNRTYVCMLFSAFELSILQNRSRISNERYNMFRKCVPIPITLEYIWYSRYPCFKSYESRPDCAGTSRGLSCPEYRDKSSIRDK